MHANNMLHGTNSVEWFLPEILWVHGHQAYQVCHSHPGEEQVQA